MDDARIEPYPHRAGEVFNVHDYYYLGLRVCFGQLPEPWVWRGDWFVWFTNKDDRTSDENNDCARFVRGGFLDAVANARDLAEEIKRRG